MSRSRSGELQGPRTQMQHYRAGDGAARLLPVSLEEWEERARTILAAGPFDYVAGGAGGRRPYAYAMAVAGQSGVVEVIQNLTAEIEIQLGVSGHKAISEIDQSLVMRYHT